MAVAPQNIMTQLRGMPDAELAKFAATYKNDPFIFPLAFQESQSRKQLRTSQQAKMAGQEQPKVVDQAMAQMAAVDPMGNVTGYLPEDTGIGRLPAKNLQRMADGGIVAFEEGGEVPGYAKGDLIFDPLGMPIGAEDAEATGPEVIGGTTLRERLGLGNAANRMALEKLDRDMKDRKTALTPIDDTKTGTKPAPSKLNPSVGGGAKIPATGAATAPGLPALTAGYTATTPEELMKTSRLMAADANKESDTAYKPYSEMLQKERGDLEKRKGDNFNMALLQAGLGMMGGTSRYAMQNIAQGGMQGLQAYNEAKRADDAARKALMGSEIALMQAQRAERSGNHKDAVALLGQAEQSKQFGVSSALKAQEIKQTGEYQRGMVAAYQARAAGGGGGMYDKMLTQLQMKTNADVAKANPMATGAELARLQQAAFMNAVQSNPVLSQRYAEQMGGGTDPNIRELPGF